MDSTALKNHIVTVLDNLKGQEICALDVQTLTAMTDYFVIVSGSSNRHVRSMASRLVEEIKKIAIYPVGVEGESSGEWVLVDLQDVVVHIMLPKARDFYHLEKLWDVRLCPPAVTSELAWKS